MTTEQLEDFEQLGRRAVACKHFRWMPGMVTTTGVRILRRDDDGYTIGYGPRTSYCVMQVFPDSLPDLSDPATLGCLLALVREAWGDEWLACKGEYSPHGATWLIYSGKPHGRRFLTQVAGTRYPTESGALVAALEAAP